MTSISFDRAADFYDETRALPEEVQKTIVRNLSAEIRDKGRCLEIGVGTGRFAIPLSVEGVDMFGLDLSKPMLLKLIERQSALESNVRVLRGDATRLPFADQVFGSSMAVHVLHLISDWQGVLEELTRVVRVGGTLLFDLGTSSPEQKVIEDLIKRRFGRPIHIGLTDAALLREFLEARGAQFRSLEPVIYRRSVRPARFVERILSNQFSFTWRMSDDERRVLADDVEHFLKDMFEDLESPREFERRIDWVAFDLSRSAGD